MFRTVIARGFGVVCFVPFPTGGTPVVPVAGETPATPIMGKIPFGPVGPGGVPSQAATSAETGRFFFRPTPTTTNKEARRET